MFRTRSLAVFSATALAVSLAACAPVASGDDDLQLVVTTTQLGDFTRQIVGDAPVSVHQLLAPNQSAHHFDPSAADLALLSQADALIISGRGLEEWVDDTVTASGFQGEVIDSSALVPEPEHADEEHGDDDHGDHDHGEDHADHEHDHADDHADHDHADHGHEHGDEEHDDHAEHDHAEHDHGDAEHDHDHDHGGLDPHIWTSMRNAHLQIEHISAQLQRLSPDHASDFAANAEAYLRQLDALEAWTAQNIATVPIAERLLVTQHQSMTAFNDDYGLTFIGAVIPSFDDSAEPSAAQIDALIAAIRSSGAKAVFAEASLSPAAAETIAREAGVQVFGGAQALYVDSLGPAGSDGESYLSAQEHNVRMLMASWGYPVASLPAELAE